MTNRRILVAALVLGVVVIGLIIVGSNILAPSSRGGVAEIVVPELSAFGRVGKTAFDANCAQCHGKNAAGTGKGPPLVHDIYNPGHHADEAFFRAVRRGVRQHHWPFGNMPIQPRLSDDEISVIVRYVREMQLANGIKYRRHQMQ